MPSAWHLWLLPWLYFVNKNDTDRKASSRWVRFKDSSIEEPRSGSYRDVLSAQHTENYLTSRAPKGNNGPWKQIPVGRGAWWAAVSGVTQSWTRLRRLSSSSSSTLNVRHLNHITSFPRKT